ncbi:hypothetical protein BWZ22_08665 [Seonamhaeicola sp. S2-3]|uniref:hypothetical protein n=1 Tax=Seonamhaeicola sp. S2-3 TaxID=1936081 RepID=UPI000972AC23|nr:hypothetical protein [Seonamhaeicola sp. S2-3]APY11308.1 hypothetical protein BWZ22_08665 [Seonamhaeicola sp. S2-3]
MRGFQNRELAKRAGQKSTRAGISDKMTIKTRECFKNLIENNLERLQDDLNSLEPKDRLKIIISLSAFVLPKLNAVDVTTGGEQLERYVTLNFKDDE